MKTLAAQLADAAARYERLVKLHGPNAKRTIAAHQITKAIRNRMIKHDNRRRKAA